MIKYIKILFILNLFCTTSFAIIFPEKDWIEKTPESQGIDTKNLNKALQYLKQNCNQDGIQEVIIIRNGFMIFKGDSIDKKHGIWSCTKSFTSTALGLLIEDGKCTLETLAMEFEPLLKEKYPNVTLKHFATMTSGYSAVGISRWDSTSQDWSWTPFQPADPLFQPGTEFCYWDEAMLMNGRVLTRICGQSLKDYLTKRVTDPIGMGEWSWQSEGKIDGIPINWGCSGIESCARQLARFGYLFLNMGNWKGKQIINNEWVKKATRAHVPANLTLADTDRKNIDGRGVYGYNWWVNDINANKELLFQGAPQGMYSASGFNHNKCFVIPQWNMVVVRMGLDGTPANADLIWSTFFKMVSDSFE